MNYKMLSLNYTFSEDYEKLFELMHTEIVVCFADYYSFDQHKRFKEDEEEKELYDVCTTQRYEPYKGGLYEIGCRGSSYISALNKEDFLEQCQKRKLKYIIPH